MLKPIDYDARQHKGYLAGRDLGPASALAWARVFERHAPPTRPLTTLDLGSGTGRFTGVLVETFGAAALGVEPSDRMREIAIAKVGTSNTRFLQGRAEAIPAGDQSFDLVLLFLSFHHIGDRSAAAVEIARVLKPGGRVMIRSQFADRFPDLRWHAFFPRAREIELQMFPTLTAVEGVFAQVGLFRTAFEEVQECFAPSLAAHAERLHHRAISTFDHLSPEELDAGFLLLDRAAKAETPPRPVFARSDLLVLG